MFHDLLLRSLLFSGMFLISAMLLIGVFYSSATTQKKKEYLKMVRKLCTSQRTFIVFGNLMYLEKKMYLKNIDLCLLEHKTWLALWDSQVLLGEGDLPGCCGGIQVLSPRACGKHSSRKSKGASGRDAQSLNSSQSWRKGLS